MCLVAFSTTNIRIPQASIPSKRKAKGNVFFPWVECPRGLLAWPWNGWKVDYIVIWHFSKSVTSHRSQDLVHLQFLINEAISLSPHPTSVWFKNSSGTTSNFNLLRTHCLLPALASYAFLIQGSGGKVNWRFHEVRGREDVRHHTSLPYQHCGYHGYHWYETAVEFVLALAH